MINKDHEIYYRDGTFGDKDTAGINWLGVPGKMKWISHVEILLWGVTETTIFTTEVV